MLTSKPGKMARILQCSIGRPAYTHARASEVRSRLAFHARAVVPLRRGRCAQIAFAHKHGALKQITSRWHISCLLSLDVL